MKVFGAALAKNLSGKKFIHHIAKSVDGAIRLGNPDYESQSNFNEEKVNQFDIQLVEVLAKKLANVENLHKHIRIAWFPENIHSRCTIATNTTGAEYIYVLPNTTISEQHCEAERLNAATYVKYLTTDDIKACF